MDIQDKNAPFSPLQTKGDHRVRVTKTIIREAFTRLLRQKPIQNISIKELCTLAGINRGTFYLHYTDIYALLEEIETGMLRDFETALLPVLSVPDGGSPVEICTEIFRCLKENSDMCVIMLGDYSDKQFVAKLLSLGKEKCMQAYSQYFKGATPKQIEYFYAFVSEGCIGLLRQWLLDGMTLPAEEVARMAEKIMLDGIRFLNVAQPL